MFDLLKLNIKYATLISLVIAVVLILLGKSILLILITFIVIFLVFTERYPIIISLIIITYLAFTGPDLITNRTAVNIASLILLLFIFIKKYGLAFRNYPRLPSGVIFLVFMLIFIFSTSTGINGFQQNSIEAVIRSIIFFLICYFLYSFIENKTQLFIYINTLFIVFMIISLGVYIEIISSGFTLFGKSGLFARYSGFYENPNYVGVIVLVVSSLISVLFFNNSFTKKSYKYFLTFLIINIVIVSILVNSRASLLGLLLALVVILINLDKKLLLKTFLFSAVGIFILLQIKDVKNLIDLFLRFETIAYREDLWKSGIKMFLDHPLVGVGPDRFLEYFFNYIPSSTGFLVQAVFLGGKAHPHNFFLFLGTENGILGITSAIAIFYFFFYYCLKSIKLAKKKSDKDYYLLAVASTGICSGYFIRTFSDAEGILSYGYITRDLPFWLIFIFSVFIYQKLISETNFDKKLI